VLAGLDVADEPVEGALDHVEVERRDVAAREELGPAQATLHPERQVDHAGVERTRELGLLRAVGMARSQVRATVRWESVIIALLGTVTGLVIGLGFAWALMQTLADQGFDVLSVPVLQLGAIVALGLSAFWGGFWAGAPSAFNCSAVFPNASAWVCAIKFATSRS